MNIVFNRMFPKCPIHHNKSVAELLDVRRKDDEHIESKRNEEEIHLYDRHACVVHGFKRGIEVDMYV